MLGVLGFRGLGFQSLALYNGSLLGPGLSYLREAPNTEASGA